MNSDVLRYAPFLANRVQFFTWLHRLQVGTLLVHVGVRRGDRRAAFDTVKKCAVPAAVREAMGKWAVKEGEEHNLGKVLIASVSNGATEPLEGAEKAENEVIASVVVAHKLGGQAVWVDMCRQAGVDPASVVGKKGAEAVAIVCNGDEVRLSCISPRLSHIL